MERVRDWWSLVIFIGRVYRRALGTRKKKERGYEGVRELEKNEETWNEREKEKKSVQEKDREKKASAARRACQSGDFFAPILTGG